MQLTNQVIDVGGWKPGGPAGCRQQRRQTDKMGTNHLPYPTVLTETATDNGHRPKLGLDPTAGLLYASAQRIHLWQVLTRKDPPLRWTGANVNGNGHILEYGLDRAPLYMLE